MYRKKQYIECSVLPVVSGLRWHSGKVPHTDRGATVLRSSFSCDRDICSEIDFTRDARRLHKIMTSSEKVVSFSCSPPPSFPLNKGKSSNTHN